MRMWIAGLCVVVGGCLSVLPPPESTGVVRGFLGSNCVESECPGGFACNEYGSCESMCFDNGDCKKGYLCCDYDNVIDTYDNTGICPETYECFKP